MKMSAFDDVDKYFSTFREILANTSIDSIKVVPTVSVPDNVAVLWIPMIAEAEMMEFLKKKENEGL